MQSFRKYFDVYVAYIILDTMNILDQKLKQMNYKVHHLDQEKNKLR